MHWIRRHRRGRPPHPDVLTPAEWRVLELVREGHPNAEIAARLGITMATVKTHVTRILAKTDTRDRHELAQWEGEPAVPAATPERGRGFALLPVGWSLAGWSTGAKVAGATASAVVFLGAVFAAFWVLGDSDALLSSRVTVAGDHWVIELEAEARGSLPEQRFTRSHGEIRTWREDGGPRSRTEWVMNGERPVDLHSFVSVSDGDTTMLYDELRDIVLSYPSPGQPDGSGTPFWGLGPGPGDTIEEVAELHLPSGAEPVQSTGRQLGRTVHVLEGGEPGVFTRIHVDPDTLFVLLQEQESGRSEVTYYDVDAQLDESLFSLDVPGSAEELDLPSLRCPDGPTWPAPVRLQLADVPAEWEVMVEDDLYLMTAFEGCVVTGAWSVFHLTEVVEPSVAFEFPYLAFEQNYLPNGIPAHLQHGDAVSAGAFEGYRTTEGDRERLIWEQDGVVAMLESDTLSFDELLGMAEAVETLP